MAWRGAVRQLVHTRALHGLAHPATAAVLDMGGLYVLYLTPLYAATTTNAVAHHLVNLHFLLVGCLFTWSIADPAPHRPTATIRALVLVAAVPLTRTSPSSSTPEHPDFRRAARTVSTRCRRPRN